MTETQKLWAVYTNSDLTEGRGREYVKHFCEKKATADRLAFKGYVQGSDCPVKEIEAVVFEGKHFLPSSIINIVPPSEDDIKVQARIDEVQRVVSKAKELGMTEKEIETLVRG